MGERRKPQEAREEAASLAARLMGAEPLAAGWRPDGSLVVIGADGRKGVFVRRADGGWERRP